MTKEVGIYIYDRFQLLDASGPMTVFELAERFVPGSYKLCVISKMGGNIRSSSGLIVDSVAANATPLPDTVVIVGGTGTEEATQCADTMSYLRTCAVHVRRLCSVCSGAFLLASAGLLDGRRATTHWRLAKHLQNLHPEIRVESDRIYVRDGMIWTSGGVSAGIDMALSLIAEDLGEGIARRVAQEMVVYYRRPGGQSQFSVLAKLAGEDNPFTSLLEWMRSNLSQPLTVEQLADHAAMSPRNFSRAFARSTGVSPAKAVERLRLEAARERVESSREPIEYIAAATGFHDPERMRRAFIRTFGQPPQALRRASR